METDFTVATLDSHRHFWRYNDEEFGWIADSSLQRDFLPDDCAGMDDCIAVEARQCIAETEWLLSLARRHPFIKGVVGWLPIASPDFPRALEEVLSANDAKAAKLVGLRHVVQDEPDDDFILGEAFNSGVRHLLSEGYAYDILVFERHLPNVLKFVDSHAEDARFVIDHLAKPHSMEPWRSLVKELAKRENVYCKLSGLVTETNDSRPCALFPYLEAALDAFGPRRVMFGSDWPVVTAHMTYSGWKNAFMEFATRLSQDEQAAVMGGNARRFYRI